MNAPLPRIISFPDDNWWVGMAWGSIVGRAASPARTTGCQPAEKSGQHPTGWQPLVPCRAGGPAYWQSRRPAREPLPTYRFFQGTGIRSHWLRLLAAMAVLILGSGCTTGSPEMLADRLRALSPAVNSGEAALTAHTAIDYSRKLGRDFHAIPPAASFNNVLINLGIHSRGLCFQWADDLTVKLMTLHLRSLVLHRGVAHMDTRHEHSCVVLTGVGQSFTNGLVLDAWRRGGHLVWAPVTQDKFPWLEVELIPTYRAELQTAADKMEAAEKR